MNHSNNSYIRNAIINQQQNLNLKHFNGKCMLGKYNLLYLNINSLRNKLNDLEIELFNLTQNKNKIVHLIALTETRIDESEIPFFNIQNYTAYHCARVGGSGGVALFVHDSLTSHLIDSTSYSNVELLTVNIVNINVKVLVVYKQLPVAGEAFVDVLRSRIENKKNIIVVGDTNLNLLSDTNINKKYSFQMGYPYSMELKKNTLLESQNALKMKQPLHPKQSLIILRPTALVSLLLLHKTTHIYQTTNKRS